MLGKKPHSPIIVLAAPGSGGERLTHALSTHNAVHGVDDGALLADMLRALDVLVEEERSDQRPGQIVEILSATREQMDTASDTAAHGTTISPETRASVLKRMLEGEQSASDASGRLKVARDLAKDLARELASEAGKPCLAIHAVGGATRAAGILNLLPDAVIVHVVRDGRAIALLEAHASPTPTGLRPFAQAWLSNVEPLLRFGADHPERVVKVAYEDLLTAPAAAFDRLCTWLALESRAEDLSAAFGSGMGDLDRFAFRSDALDAWQILELESELQPLLSLLGYRPAADLEGVARMRMAAERGDAAVTELVALRARLAASKGGADDRTRSTAPDLETLRREADLYRDTLDELRQLRFQMEDQQDLPADIATLRWKAKRYDQLRAAASPILLVKRRRRGS